jgi:adenine C2-methylase RlmN of 23S rRNA A2503 and tRNA A37
MPINRKYNLNLLLGTLREELNLRKKQIVLFEYVMLSGVNDRSDICFGVFADCFCILLISWHRLHINLLAKDNFLPYIHKAYLFLFGLAAYM